MVVASLCTFSHCLHWFHAVGPAAQIAHTLIVIGESLLAVQTRVLLSFVLVANSLLIDWCLLVSFSVCARVELLLP